ncbi:acyl-CoA dehydrogenase family protein [Thermodesulfobacteriota bacterium]
MDFTFNEEQDLLRDTALRFVEKESGIDIIKQLVDGEKEFTEEKWMKMAELGWPAILIPEEYEGLGLSFIELAVILEEMGKGPMPGPFISTIVLAGEAIRLAGNSEQKQKYLPGIAAGELKGTLAWAEADSLYHLGDMKVKAQASGESFLLKGTKIFVPDADEADVIICVAKMEEGAGLFLVEKQDSAAQVNALVTMDRTTKLSEVVFDEVMIPKTAVLGQAGQAENVLGEVMNRISVAYSMDMIGGGQKVLDIGVEYAKTRVQFGQPIGSFQAIKHKCAELLMDIEGARSIAYYAAWAQDQDQKEATINASAAKAFCTEMYRKATKEVLQILGGIGFSWEHELHIFLKRAKCLGALFGDVTYHRERIAREMEY